MLGVLGAVIAPSASAQPPVTPTDSAAVRDAAPRPANGLAATTRQTFSSTLVVRNVRVGTTALREQSAPLEWRLVTPHVSARVSGTPVSLAVPAQSLTGLTPVRGRLDLVRRAGDTLSVYARYAGLPVGLDSAQIAAVSNVGTSVVDLASQSLGVSSQLGVRAKMAFPVGALVLGVSAAVERDLAPPATGAVFWQGTTMRAGASVTGFAGAHAITLGLDLARSSTDSLGGRNLFQGGGAAVLSATTMGPTPWASATLAADLFLVRPFANERPDQPTRLIPQGQLLGVSTLLFVDVGSITVTPAITLFRESSAASVTVQDGTTRTTTSLTGSAWSANASVAFDLPVSSRFTLAPELGVTSGNVRAQLTELSGRVIGRRGRVITTNDASAAFSDPLRGVWVTVGARITL